MASSWILFVTPTVLAGIQVVEDSYQFEGSFILLLCNIRITMSCGRFLPVCGKFYIIHIKHGIWAKTAAFIGHKRVKMELIRPHIIFFKIETFLLGFLSPICSGHSIFFSMESRLAVFVKTRPAASLSFELWLAPPLPPPQNATFSTEPGGNIPDGLIWK